MIFDFQLGDRVYCKGNEDKVFTIESIKANGTVTFEEIFGFYPCSDLTKYEPTLTGTLSATKITKEFTEYERINCIKEEIMDQLSEIYKDINKLEREIVEKKSVANGLERAINVINLESNFPKEERKELMAEIKKKINKI